MRLTTTFLTVFGGACFGIFVVLWAKATWRALMGPAAPAPVPPSGPDPLVDEHVAFPDEPRRPQLHIVR
jgi:hypothetical protein